jgi:hypothetical protein
VKGASGKMASNDTYYKKLITFAFDRPGNLDSWAWDINLEEPAASPVEQAVAIRDLCINSGEDLKGFTNLQVAGGLKYIFNNSFSNMSFVLLDNNTPVGLRKEALLSLNSLFADCFAPRCTPTLSHELSESLDNAMNEVCYMFWDVSPLSGGGKDVLNVMENSLYLKNIACVESGLHGLGHRFHIDGHIIEKVIDKFLATKKETDQALFEYAKNARKGRIL